MSSTVGVDVEEILDPLETIEDRGFGRYDVFRDWVDLMLSALQRDDDAYLETLDRYDRDGDHDRGERIPDWTQTPTRRTGRWPMRSRRGTLATGGQRAYPLLTFNM